MSAHGPGPSDIGDRPVDVDGPPTHIGARAADVSGRPTDIGAARRTLDIVGAGLGLVVLSLLLAVIALLVRVTSHGPVLFRQQRVGGQHREFTILKFRTMQTTTTAGPEVTSPGDARITRVGALLRRTSLDELPQLLNVLRGDMTLVGPRPETPALAARYPAECQWVFEHRPGLTGPTQVRLRDFNTIPEGIDDAERWYLEHLVPARVATDASYLDHPSLAGTLGVLLDTARHLVSGDSPATGPAVLPAGRSVR